MGAVDGSHLNIEKPKTNVNDYMNCKGHYSFNVQAAVNYQYCFFDVIIKWPGRVHDARIFGLNESLGNEYIPSCSKIMAEGYRYVFWEVMRTLCCFFLMKEFVNGRSNGKVQFFGFKCSSVHMLTECTFERLKGRFGCLRREMDINIEDLPCVIHASVSAMGVEPITT